MSGKLAAVSAVWILLISLALPEAFGVCKPKLMLDGNKECFKSTYLSKKSCSLERQTEVTTQLVFPGGAGEAGCLSEQECSPKVPNRVRFMQMRHSNLDPSDWLDSPRLVSFMGPDWSLLSSSDWAGQVGDHWSKDKTRPPLVIGNSAPGPEQRPWGAGEAPVTEMAARSSFLKAGPSGDQRESISADKSLLGVQVK